MSGTASWNPDDALAPYVDWSAGTIPGTTGQADPNATGVAGSAGITLGTGTGQHGQVPLTGEGGGVGAGVEAVWNWINTPFHVPLSAADIFIIVGVLLIAIMAWNLILYHIRIAAETI